MSDTSEMTWWRRTRQFAAATVAGMTILSLALLFLATPLGGRVVFGGSLGRFLLDVVAPLAVLAAVFVFATQQQALDRRYDVAED